MTVLLPRLDRETTHRIIEDVKGLSPLQISARLPVTDVVTTESPVGGVQIGDAALVSLRKRMLQLAQAHDYPAPSRSFLAFEAECARLLHDGLGISPHEASQESVWSYLTACWFLDVAVWRWGGAEGDKRRFHGDVNRNTFRRLWWRKEVFGPAIDLALLGEDELVNIMERPSVSADKRLVRELTRQFLTLAERGDQPGRMMLMRESTKWLVRLTPVIDLRGLPDEQLARLVADVLAAAVHGAPLAPPAIDEDWIAPPPADIVETVELFVAPVASESPTATEETALADVAAAALEIARRTGSVRNLSLRETVPGLDAQSAREVLQRLVAAGYLQRRGQAKGTYYVPAAAVPDAVESTSASPVSKPGGESALRRFLRRTGS